MKKTRLGILVLFDEDGIVDDYVFWLLCDICDCLNNIVIVINGEILPEYEARLRGFTKYIINRENKGFDAAAFKYAMTRYWNWDEIGKYDELVLLNDTFFGPFYSFGEVFKKMDLMALDFWGLTRHYEVVDVYGNCPYGFVPEHIQSYFMVIGKSMHRDESFRLYWENLPVFDSFEDVVGKHEAVFTRYFEEKGFKWDTYVDIGYCKSEERNQNFNAYAIDPYILISKKRMPVLKRKNFVFSLTDTMSFNRGNEMYKCMEYIRSNTIYDEGLIWQNILRKYNIADIFSSLGMEYIVPNNYVESIESIGASGRVLLVLHIYYVEGAAGLAKYVKGIPDDIDVIVTTSSEEKMKGIKDLWCGRKIEFLIVPNRGRDISSLLVAIRDVVGKYDYLCFCHDKRTSRYSLTVGRDFQELLWENLLSSKEYIYNILNIFNNDRYLGLLTPPSPIHGGYRALLGNRWTVNYQNVEKLLKRIGVTVKLQKDKMPLTMGTAFWCRTKALRKLWEYPWDYEKFPVEPISSDGEINHAVERGLAYIAQDAGFYTAWVMTPRQAVLEARNARHMLEQMVQKTECENIEHMGGGEGRQMIIYGAGNWGQMAFERYQALCDIIFFVDKNESKHGLEKCGKKICPIKDISEHRNAIILIAVEQSDGIARHLKEMFDNDIVLFHPWGSAMV